MGMPVWVSHCGLFHKQWQGQKNNDCGKQWGGINLPKSGIYEKTMYSTVSFCKTKASEKKLTLSIHDSVLLKAGV